MSEAIPDKKHRRIGIFLKALFTLAALTIIILKADLRQIWQDLQLVSPSYIFIAFIFLNAGQIVSALRMRYYFMCEGLILSKKFSILFYLAGNFFNLILPGGIGGDGYKAYLMKKLKDFPVLKGVKLILSGRASGLLLLVLIALGLALFSKTITALPFAKPLIIAAFFANIVGYSILARFILQEKIPTQIGAAGYSFFVQILVLATAYFLFKGAGIGPGIGEYLLLFMISSIISVLPISMGGVGLRELTFFKGAPLFNLSPELGIAIAIIYFFINSLSSLIGLLFINRLKYIIDK